MGQYLICYDIKDPKRLQKVYKYLCSYGRHIQYSVFLCEMEHRGIQQVKHHLESLIDQREDDVRIYSLPQRFKVAILGRGDRIPEGVFIFSTSN